MFSTDGRWLACASDETGQYEIYVQPFGRSSASQGPRTPISNEGGFYPVWASNGKDLLYQSGDQIMAVSYSVKGGAFVKEKPPRPWLSKLGVTQNSGLPMWDIAQDGKRVLVAAPANAPRKADHDLVLLQNFLDELHRRVLRN